MSSHAICVFQKADDGMFYWTDYRLPEYLDDFRDKWAYRSAATYEASPIAAVMVEVKYITSDDTPVFGEKTIMSF